MIDAIQAEEMNMSIWLKSDGLSFAVLPKGAGTLAEAEEEGFIPFVAGYSLRENFEHALYAEARLSLPYAEVTVYYTPERIALVPEALFDEADTEVWEPTLRKSLEEIVRPFRLKNEDKILLGAIPRDAVEFLERSYLVVSFCPSYAERLSTLRAEAQTSLQPKLLVWLSPQCVTLSLVEPQGLSYINAFAYVRPSDEGSLLGEIMYYLSLVWQSLGLNEHVGLTVEAAEETDPSKQAMLSSLVRAVLAEMEE